MATARPSPPRRTRALLGVAVVLGAVAAAVLLGPAVHALATTVRADVAYAKVFRYLLAALVLGAGLVMLKPWRDVPPDLYGLRGPRSRPLLVLPGAAVAVGGLVAIALADAAAGHLGWDEREGAQKFLHRLPTALVRGAVLGTIEEVFFCGWFFARVRRVASPLRAALVVALVFGALHAFRESDAPKRIGPGVAEGLAILRAWGANLVNLADFGPSFLGLSLFSLGLLGAYLRFRTLWFGVGLHGAAVAWLPLHSAATARAVDRDGFGSKWLYDNPVGWVVLGAMAFLLWPRRRAAPPGGAAG